MSAEILTIQEDLALDEVLNVNEFSESSPPEKASPFEFNSIDEIVLTLENDQELWKEVYSSPGGDILKRDTHEWAYKNEKGKITSMTESNIMGDRREQIVDELFEKGSSVSEVQKADDKNTLVREVYHADSKGNISYKIFVRNLNFEPVIVNEDDDFDFSDVNTVPLSPFKNQATTFDLSSALSFSSPAEKPIQKESAWNTFWNDLVTPKATEQKHEQPAQVNLLDLFSPIAEPAKVVVPSRPSASERRPARLSHSGGDLLTIPDVLPSTGITIAAPANTAETSNNIESHKTEPSAVDKPATPTEANIFPGLTLQQNFETNPSIYIEEPEATPEPSVIESFEPQVTSIAEEPTIIQLLDEEVAVESVEQSEIEDIPTVDIQTADKPAYRQGRSANYSYINQLIPSEAQKEAAEGTIQTVELITVDATPKAVEQETPAEDDEEEVIDIEVITDQTNQENTKIQELQTAPQSVIVENAPVTARAELKESPVRTILFKEKVKISEEDVQIAAKVETQTVIPAAREAVRENAKEQKVITRQRTVIQRPKVMTIKNPVLTTPLAEKPQAAQQAEKSIQDLRQQIKSLNRVTSPKQIEQPTQIRNVVRERAQIREVRATTVESRTQEVVRQPQAAQNQLRRAVSIEQPSLKQFQKSETPKNQEATSAILSSLAKLTTPRENLTRVTNIEQYQNSTITKPLTYSVNKIRPDVTRTEKSRTEIRKVRPSEINTRRPGQQAINQFSDETESENSQVISLSAVA